MDGCFADASPLSVIRDYLRTNRELAKHAMSVGVTHLRVRKVGRSLVIHGFAPQSDMPVKGDPKDRDGYWFRMDDGRAVMIDGYGCPPAARMTAIAKV